MSNRLSRLIATAGGIGYFPFAPGTWAAGILAIFWFIICQNFPDTFAWQLILIPIIIGGGVYYSEKIITDIEKDPSHVVIDEVAGMSLTLLLIPPSYQNILAGFILFRFFDILKPLGIKKMENMRGGWGIMFDDVLAGIYSNIALRLLIFMKIW